MAAPRNTDPYQSLFSKLCSLYDNTLQSDIKSNQRYLQTYWHIGKTILAMIGDPNRKEQYGKKIIIRLSDDLSQKYGDGFKPRTIRYFRDFAAQYRATDLNAAISWSHYRALLGITDTTVRAQLEQRILNEQLSKVELENIVAKYRKVRSGNHAFSLSPRSASPGIFKIDAIEPNTQRVVADLGFNIKRTLTLPGITPAPGAHMTQISSRNFTPVAIETGERYCYIGTPIDVIDGDTVKMQINLLFDTAVVLPLRLRGVDAMEIDTPEGQKAKRALANLIKNQTDITVYTYSHDRYGRYIADLVTSDGAYINKQLVEKGHARFLKMK
ncbi:MAG: thermonuclease family protein [Deltaproteobacteria bacterium]|nr:thermonuclease family protein [Deltaproteobacteria bacterium]